MHGLRQMYHRLRKSFRAHSMVFLGDKAQVETRFSPFRGSANLDATCMVCAEQTIGLENILEARG